MSRIYLYAFNARERTDGIIFRLNAFKATIQAIGWVNAAADIGAEVKVLQLTEDQVFDLAAKCGRQLTLAPNDNMLNLNYNGPIGRQYSENWREAKMKEPDHGN